MKAVRAKTNNNYDLADLLEDSHFKSLKSQTLLLLRDIEFLANIRTEIEVPLIKDNMSFETEVGRFEMNLIKSALVRSGGNQTQAADFLGVKLTTLIAKIKKYKINFEDLL